MSRKIPIFYSALLLTGVNLLLRVVGTSFQVYLSGTIGAEGIGLLQLVLSVGSMAMVAAMAGIRTATMYLSAEQIGRGRRENLLWVLSGCTRYSLLASTAVAAAVYIAAPSIAANWIGNPRTVDALRLFGVFLPVNCLCGVMVGYFTGVNRIKTLAAVEVAEQLFSMGFTLFLLHFWADSNPERSCLAVVAGSSAGACLTLITLILLRLKEPQNPSKKIKIGKELRSTAIPLAVADNLRTGISTVENLMVPKRLARYGGVTSPLAAFGMVCGMVFPILTFPMALLFGLTELLVPELARCNAAGSTIRIGYLVRRSLQIALFFGAFCALLLYLGAEALCMGLYGSAEAGQYLKWFSPLALMLYCDAVTDAMIKGLGQQHASVRYNIFTNVLDVIFLYLLLPRYGIFGYFVSFTVTHVINFLLSLRRLLKITGICLDLKMAFLTVVATVTCGMLCAGIENIWAKVITAATLFFALLHLFKVVKHADFLWLKGLIMQKNRPAR